MNKGAQSTSSAMMNRDSNTMINENGDTLINSVGTTALPGFDIWTQAIEKRNATGRGSSKKISLHGIKKLRELILELAVRGKLVPQDSKDEPASVLLEKIAEEKALLIKEKKIKKSKALPPISDEEKPFELPNAWEWVRFGEATYLEMGQSPKSDTYNQEKNGIAFFQGKADFGDKYPTARYWCVDPKKMAYPNDVLLSVRAPVGPTNICNLECCIGRGLAAVRPLVGMDAVFVDVLLKGFRSSLEEQATGTTFVAVSKVHVENLIVSLPPLAEQKRIVAKVDELMALCDQMEEQTEASLEAHEVLVDCLLKTLTESQSSADLAQNWQRVSHHFDTLFTTESSIDKLKKVILQLAVMGKLVPQDPSDEPASVLLKKIASEKAQLIKDKKIKKSKALPPISDEEKPFELPTGWELTRFGNFSNEIATGPFGSMIHKSDYVKGGVPLINPSHMINSVIVEDVNVSVSQSKAEELSSYKLYANDIVMARRGEMGRCALVTERENSWLCGTGSFVLRFDKTVNREFVLLLFATAWVRSYLGGMSIGTTMTNLNHGILNKLPLLLPPLAEQKRIVAKVDSLMALCDQLKSRLTDSQLTKVQLATTIVENTLA